MHTWPEGSFHCSQLLADIMRPHSVRQTIDPTHNGAFLRQSERSCTYRPSLSHPLKRAPIETNPPTHTHTHTHRTQKTKSRLQKWPFYCRLHSSRTFGKTRRFSANAFSANTFGARINSALKYMSLIKRWIVYDLKYSHTKSQTNTHILALDINIVFSCSFILFNNVFKLLSLGSTFATNTARHLFAACAASFANRCFTDAAFRVRFIGILLWPPRLLHSMCTWIRVTVETLQPSRVRPLTNRPVKRLA